MYGQPQINYAGLVNQNGGYRYGSPASNQQNRQGNQMAGNQSGYGGNGNQLFDQFQRADTPFHAQQIKDAFGAHANMGNQIGSAFASVNAGNQAAAQNARERGINWAQNQNVLPFEFSDMRQDVNQAYGGVKQGAPDKFSSWLKMNEEYQNNRANIARKNAYEDAKMQYDPFLMQERRNAGDTARQMSWNDMPLMQYRMDMMKNLFGGLGMGGGGASGFNTNFGASGTGGGIIPFPTANA